jgi:hypothetical protein
MLVVMEFQASLAVSKKERETERQRGEKADIKRTLQILLESFYQIT